MILLWGRPSEAPLAEVRDALARRGAEIFFLDEARAINTTLHFGDSEICAGQLRVDCQELDLADVGGAYLRPYGVDIFTSSLWAWADMTEATILNRPSLMNSHAFKPLQALMLASLGFEVPDTLLTNDSDAAKAFAHEHRRVIYKSTSAVRSIVATIDASNVNRLRSLGTCPVQFQAHIPGTDVRVHVVGDDLFACEGGGEGMAAQVVRCDLPAAVADRCHRASVVLGLPLCGIDLRRTPEGRWVAFEVHPSPGFSFFAAATGAPIADAIAGLLMAEAGHCRSPGTAVAAAAAAAIRLVCRRSP